MSKIQSVSDIITNSSSEVFIIDSKNHDKITTFLKDVCDLFGWDVYDLMEFDSVTRDGDVDGHKYKKGNLLIWSTGDNSIPSVIMDIIEDIRWNYIPAIEDVKVKDLKRIHLG